MGSANARRRYNITKSLIGLYMRVFGMILDNRLGDIENKIDLSLFGNQWQVMLKNDKNNQYIIIAPEQRKAIPLAGK